MSFDHTKGRNNCMFFGKTTTIDQSLTPDANVDSVEVAGTYYPNAPGAIYRGKDKSYDTSTCPAPSPLVPTTPQCDTKIQSDHGPNSCTCEYRQFHWYR